MVEMKLSERYWVLNDVGHLKNKEVMIIFEGTLINQKNEKYCVFFNVVWGVLWRV